MTVEGEGKTHYLLKEVGMGRNYERQRGWAVRGNEAERIEKWRERVALDGLLSHHWK